MTPSHVLRPRRRVEISFASRAIILACVFALAAGLLVLIDHRPVETDARWPSDPTTFAVPGWVTGSESLDQANGVTYATRTLNSAVGPAAISIATSAEAKRIYRAGADIPFLGNGYTVEPAPASLVPESDSRTAFVVQRGSERGVLLFAYGERRGLIGNGPASWLLATLDGVLARPNNYYMVRVYAPLGELDPVATHAVAQLADALFPRVAAWYAG